MGFCSLISILVFTVKDSYEDYVDCHNYHGVFTSITGFYVPFEPGIAIVSISRYKMRDNNIFIFEGSVKRIGSPIKYFYLNTIFTTQ